MTALSGGQDWVVGAQLCPYAKPESPEEGLAGFLAAIKGQELDGSCYCGLYLSSSVTCSFYPFQQVGSACWSLMGWEELDLGSCSLTPFSAQHHGVAGPRWDHMAKVPWGTWVLLFQPAHPLGRHTGPHRGLVAQGWKELQ